MRGWLLSLSLLLGGCWYGNDFDTVGRDLAVDGPSESDGFVSIDMGSSAGP